MLILCGCAVGTTHTSDSTLEKNFFGHEAQFEALLKDVQTDPKFDAVLPDLLRYAWNILSFRNGTTGPDSVQFVQMENLGFSQSRWNMYQRQMRVLGLKGVLTGPDSVKLRADRGSFSNGDSHKGYMYKPTPPEPAHMLLNLDSYRIDEKHRIDGAGYLVYKHLKMNWYLYLSVN
jgi:hypothetical protein